LCELCIALVSKELNLAFLCEFSLHFRLIELDLLVVLEEPKIMSKTTSHDQLSTYDCRSKVEARFDVLYTT
jgi:hypothetical protein